MYCLVFLFRFLFFFTWLESLHSSLWWSPFSNLYSFQTAWSSSAWKRLYLLLLKKRMETVIWRAYFLSQWHRRVPPNHRDTFQLSVIDDRCSSSITDSTEAAGFRKCLVFHRLNSLFRWCRTGADERKNQHQFVVCVKLIYINSILKSLHIFERKI